MTVTDQPLRQPLLAGQQRLLSPVGAPVDLQAHVRRHGPLPPQGPALLGEVERSGLLGRGGGGFPLARKMRAAATGRRRPIVVGNGCEGEPASAKDLVLLTRAPHLVLDGLQAAAGALDAATAYLTVHDGSPAYAVLAHALAERRHGSLDRVPVELRTAPARYVASEASALVHALDGGAALPTTKPPHATERGVGKRPTVVSNVETLAHLALVARHGGDWFRAVGDPAQPGTVLVTVAGPGAEAGVLEVPTGTPLGVVLAAAGVDTSRTSAVLTGGYGGAWLPREVARGVPLTSADLAAVGGTLGAGVLLALPDECCGVAETARVAAYLARQSAGQCGPCLNGLPAIAGAMHRLALGPWDEQLAGPLRRWLGVVPGRGACHHPDGAVRFVASAFAVFAADVDRHRTGRGCHATPAWLPVPAS